MDLVPADNKKSNPGRSEAPGICRKRLSSCYVFQLVRAWLVLMTPRLLVPVQAIHLRGKLNDPRGSLPAQNILWFRVILWSFQGSSEGHKAGELGCLFIWSINTQEPSTESTAETGYDWHWIRNVSGEVGKAPLLCTQCCTGTGGWAGSLKSAQLEGHPSCSCSGMMKTASSIEVSQPSLL